MSFCRSVYPEPAVAAFPIVEPATATSRSVAFVVVTDEVCKLVVLVEPDPLAVWSTLQVRPEYSAMYKSESPPVLVSVAVT